MTANLYEERLRAIIIFGNAIGENNIAGDVADSFAFIRKSPSSFGLSHTDITRSVCAQMEGMLGERASNRTKAGDAFSPRILLAMVDILKE